MTQKDYIKLADKIKYINNVPLQFQAQGLQNTRENVSILREFLLWEIGEVLAADNYKFSWEKWRKQIQGVEKHDPRFCFCDTCQNPPETKF